MADMADDNSVSPRKRSGSGTGRSGEDVQRRTFTRWVNAHLMKLGGGRKAGAETELVNVLHEDLRDGKNILRLLRALTGVELKTEKGNMRLHHITNINRALAFLKEQYGLDFVNFNIGAEDLAGGSPRLTLGFVWRLILRFQVQLADRGSEDGDNSNTTPEGKQRRLQRQKTVDVDVKKELLTWCQEATQHCAGVNVTDFRRSWSDGLAFLALLHRFHPELVSSWPPPSELGSSTREKADAAFRLAENELGVLSLLDAEDLVQGIVDEQSMVTYLAMLRETLGRVPEEIASNGTAAAMTDVMVEEALDEETVAPVPVLKSDSGYRTEEGVADDVATRATDESMTEATDGVADACALPGDEVEDPVGTPGVFETGNTEAVHTMEPAAVEVVPDERCSPSVALGGAAEVPATSVTSSSLENSPTNILPSQAELTDTLDESSSCSEEGSGEGQQDMFQWWPWLGLIPLFVALAYEASR